MKLSFSSNAFVRFSPVQTIRELAKIGYHGIELLADFPHLYADNVSISELKELRRTLDETGLSVSNINANTAIGYYGRTFWEPLFEPSISNPDCNLRQWRINYTKKCIEIAEFLGSRSISVTTGKPVSGIFPEQSMVVLRDALEQITAFAEKKSILVGIEYEPGLVIESSEELLEILTLVDSPFLGANLDIGHSHVLGENIPAVISNLGSRIFHVHVEDIQGKKHYHRIPGDGEIDFGAVFQALSQVGYAGFVCVELYTYPHDPVSAAQESMDYLKNFFTDDNSGYTVK